MSDEWQEPPEPEGQTEKPRKKRGRPVGWKAKPLDGRTKAALERRQEAKTVDRLQSYAADLEKIIDKQIRLVEWHQQAFINGMSASSRSANQKMFHEEDAKKLLALTKMTTDLGDMKIRWIAAAQKLGAALTPAQVLAGAIGRIMSLTRPERKKIIKQMWDDHQQMVANENPTGITFAYDLENPPAGGKGSGFDKGNIKKEPLKPVTDDLAELLGDK